MNDLIESTYSCIRCGDEKCGGECCDRKDPWDAEMKGILGLDLGVD